MSMIICPRCSATIEEHAMVCPKCRTMISEEDRASSKRVRKLWWLFGLCIFAVVVFQLYIFFAPNVAMLIDSLKQSEPFFSFFQDDIEKPDVAGVVQPYTVMFEGEGENKRLSYLFIALVPDANGLTKEGLSHEDLVATVMEAAQTHYDDDYYRIDVQIVTENSKHMHATMTLARAIYSPEESPVWVWVAAADRGINHEEQRYLTAWGELLPASQSFIGNLKIISDVKVRKEHDIAVSKYLNIEPESVDPFANQMRRYPTE